MQILILKNVFVNNYIIACYKPFIKRYSMCSAYTCQITENLKSHQTVFCCLSASEPNIWPISHGITSLSLKWSQTVNQATQKRTFTTVPLQENEVFPPLQSAVTEMYRTTEKWLDRMENRIVKAPRVILWECGYFWVQATTEDDIN